MVYFQKVRGGVTGEQKTLGECIVQVRSYRHVVKGTKQSEFWDIN